MRILFYTTKLTPGGCQINAINLGKALVKLGNQVIFLANPGPLVERVVQGGMTFIPNNPHINLSRKFMRQLSTIVAEEKIDVIQAFDSIPILEAYGSQSWHKKPVYGMFTGKELPGFRSPKAREIAIVNPNTIQKFIKRGWNNANLKLITARLDCDYYRPLDVSVQSVFKDQKLDLKLPIITLVSRIDDVKWPSISMFLSAAENWQRTREHSVPAQFLIVGGGTSFFKLLDQANLINKRFQSEFIFVDGERLDIPEVMNASTIVMGMGSTCQQGMACGRPTIVIGTKGFSSIIQPDTFEYLSNYHFAIHTHSDLVQPEILCQQIESILANEEKSKYLSVFGRKTVVDKYDSEVGAKQLEDIYSKLLEGISIKKRLDYWIDCQLSLISYHYYHTRKRIIRKMKRLFGW